MANLGVRDTKSLVMLTGWDATALQNFELQDGTTYESIVARLNAALGALNTEFANDGFANMYSISDKPDLEYRVGSSNGFERFTEYGRADAQRAATEGHMLPLQPYDRRLGWTWSYLRDARQEQIDADIADALKDARDQRRVLLLTRIFQRGDDSGEINGLGTGGYSAGFATAAASTNVDFTPPATGGTLFDSDHEHYVPLAGGVFTNNVFKDAKDELREHGHEPPYNFDIGTADETVVRALSDFTEVASSLVAYGNTQDLAQLPAGADTVGTYNIGTIHDFAVRVIRGIPQYYGWGYKSYGRMAQRNPLRARVRKGENILRVVAIPDPKGGSANDPIQDLMLLMELGFGVYDRTAGTPRYVNAGVWADGTPT